MVQNKKYTGRAVSMPAGLTMGVSAALLVTLLSAVLIAWMINAEYVAEQKTGYGIMIALMAAAYVGAITASMKIKRRKLLVCTLSGILYFAALLGITALFFGGQYEAVGVTGILVMGGAMLAALIHPFKDRGGKRKKHRNGNR